MEMAKYILSILKAQIVVVLSWGLHNAVAIENGLQFNVQGFIFSGRVQVVYDEGSDTFVVKLLKTNGGIMEEHTDVYIDDLVEVIDRAVEKQGSDEDYFAKVEAMYNL